MSPQSAATINREYFLAAIIENLSLNSDNLSPKSDHSPLICEQYPQCFEIQECILVTFGREVSRKVPQPTLRHVSWRI